MSKLDYSNGVQTKDGREAEVFAERDGYLFGRIFCTHQNEFVSARWNLDGTNYASDPPRRDHDLIPFPKIDKRYLRVFREGAGYFEKNAAICFDAAPCTGVLCFQFKDGKPDTSVAPEWVK